MEPQEPLTAVHLSEVPRGGMGLRHVRVVLVRCEAAPGLEDVVQGVFAPLLLDFWAGVAMPCATMPTQFQRLCSSSGFCPGLQKSSALTHPNARAAVYRSNCMLTASHKKSPHGEALNPGGCLSHGPCKCNFRLRSEGQLNLCAGRAASLLI